MAFDLNSLAARFSGYSAEGVKIAAAASRLYAAYKRIEPATMKPLDADLATLEAAWTALDTSLDAYNKANPVSKIAAGITIGNAIAKSLPIVTRVCRDGETVFLADWAVIKPDAELILHTLQGTQHELSFVT